MMNRRGFQPGQLDFYSKQTVAIIVLFVFFIVLNGCPGSSDKKEFSGEFLTNDNGESHGGFEWAGEYTAGLIVRGTKGDLTLTFSTGLGDYLTRHQFSISDFAEAGGSMSFKIEGRAASLVLVEDDTIWNGKYDGYFTANKSSNASEQIGHLPIEPFSGFSSHYYIDLRLKPLRPQSGFSLFN